MEFAVRAIGIVRGGLPGDRALRPKSTAEIEGRVELLPEFAEGLDGIEAFSHLFLLSYFHGVSDDARGLLRVKPKRLLQEGVRPEEIPTVGVFATDSPARPNSIALTLVRLVGREGNILVVRGLDLFDGTPLLDIKPYRSDYKAESHVVPPWAAKYDAERRPL